MTSQRARRTSAPTWIARGLLAVILLCGLAFAVDLVLCQGKTARGAHIAEFDLGNKTEDQAREVLQQLNVVSHGPIVLRTASGTAKIDPERIGARFDMDATLDRLMEQPKDPITRVAGMFGVRRDIEPVIRIDRQKFDEALDGEKKVLEKAAVEGGVHFDGVTPVGDFPAKGMRIDRDAAVTTIENNWLAGGPIDLAMEPFSPTVSAETVQAVLDGPARTVTDSSVRLRGRGAVVTASARDLGALVRFVPDGRGGLAAAVKPKDAQRVLGDRTEGTESEPVSATFRLSGGSPSVVPSKDGARVDWTKTAHVLEKAAVAESERTVTLPYRVTKPKLDTRGARRLGVDEVVSEFTTGGFSGPSGENIRLVAQEVDGAVVLPGETFSLNGHTGPRGTAQGYVDSGIIDHGRPSKAVGGGISQFATTLYNAAYFAGLEDVAHTEHAYYISRYPEAREATVFEGLIDLQFKNNTEHGVYIETNWSSSSITVRMWSTKTMDVDSVTGARTNPTSPSVVEVPASDTCVPSSGAGGFTASDTRIITDHKTGREIGRHTRTVKYDPEPIVRCR